MRESASIIVVAASWRDWIIRSFCENKIILVFVSTNKASRLTRPLKLSPWSVKTSGPAGSAVVDGEQRFTAGLCRTLTVASVEPEHKRTETRPGLMRVQSGNLQRWGRNHSLRSLVNGSKWAFPLRVLPVRAFIRITRLHGGEEEAGSHDAQVSIRMMEVRANDEQRDTRNCLINETEDLEGREGGRERERETKR